MEKHIYKKNGRPAPPVRRTLAGSRLPAQKPRIPAAANRVAAAPRNRKKKRTSPLRFWLAFSCCFGALFLCVRLGHGILLRRNPFPAQNTSGQTEPALSEATLFEAADTIGQDAPTAGEFAAEAAKADVSTTINICAESDFSLYPELQAAIAACDSVSFLAVDLSGGQTLAYAPDCAMYLASAIKAPYALFACLQLDAGVLQDDDIRIYTEDFYDEGSGNIQYSDFGTEYTLAYLLQEALRCSDNIAYRMTVDAFGKMGYNDMVRFLGADTLLFGTDIWPTATPRDTAKLWYALVQYLGSNAAHAGALNNVLCSNEYSPIRKALGYQKTVASKYGWDEASFCDCGLVYRENGEPGYLLCILTTNAVLDDPQSVTGAVIQQIDSIMNSIDQEG